MAKINVGGDAENYMEAPSIQVGGGGGFNLIASVLDALGIHKQVAKEPKAPKTEEPAAASPQNIPALSAAETAFQPVTPLPSDWGARFLEGIKPLKSIDPNTAR